MRVETLFPHSLVPLGPRFAIGMRGTSIRHCTRCSSTFGPLDAGLVPAPHARQNHHAFINAQYDRISKRLDADYTWLSIEGALAFMPNAAFASRLPHDFRSSPGVLLPQILSSWAVGSCFIMVGPEIRGYLSRLELSINGSSPAQFARFSLAPSRCPLIARLFDEITPFLSLIRLTI